MYIITEQDGVICAVADAVTYNEAHQPIVDGAYAIGFPCTVYEDVTVPDGVESGKYTYTGGVFAKNPGYPWPSLDEVREERIAASKAALADYLAGHPMTWTDGKAYAVTAEKQSLLTSQLALGQLASSSGYTPRWNATGEVCTAWTMEDLSALALAIGAYVQPLVSMQQSYEAAVRACETVEAAEAVALSYGAA